MAETKENVMGTAKLSRLILTTGIPPALFLWRRAYQKLPDNTLEK